MKDAYQYFVACWVKCDNWSIALIFASKCCFLTRASNNLGLTLFWICTQGMAVMITFEIWLHILKTLSPKWHMRLFFIDISGVWYTVHDSEAVESFDTFMEQPHYGCLLSFEKQPTVLMYKLLWLNFSMLLSGCISYQTIMTCRGQTWVEPLWSI